MIVSVVIPSYNRAHVLGRAISSVLAQGISNIEVLVVDDGSTDETAQCVEKFDKVRYIHSKKRMGPAGARNLGILSSRGEYIAFLDSDDEWAPGHLSRSLGVLQNEGLDACYSLWYRQRGDQWEGYPAKWLDNLVKDLGLTVDQGTILLGDRIAEYMVSKPFWCFHTDTLVAKKCVFEYGEIFDESLMSSEDVEFSFRLLMYNSVGLIPEYQAYYYEGEDNLVALKTEDMGKLRSHHKYTVKAFNLIRKLVESYPSILNKELCLQQLDKKIKEHEVLR